MTLETCYKDFEALVHRIEMEKALESSTEQRSVENFTPVRGGKLLVSMHVCTRHFIMHTLTYSCTIQQATWCGMGATQDHLPLQIAIQEQGALPAPPTPACLQQCR